MSKKFLPFVLGLLIAIIKMLQAIGTGDSFASFAWGLFSLAVIQITWAYWKGRDMLAPPNFDFKDGTNEFPRLLFALGAITCLLIGLLWG